jgi:hypothetical protein
MATEGEIVHRGPLAAEIEDFDLSDRMSQHGTTFGSDDDTLGSGTPRLYLDFGYGLFLQ